MAFDKQGRTTPGAAARTNLRSTGGDGVFYCFATN
jgi:hypothetical protein